MKKELSLPRSPQLPFLVAIASLAWVFGSHHAAEPQQTNPVFESVSLKPYFTASLTDAINSPDYVKENNLAEMPTGRQVLAGVPFEIHGLVQLSGKRVVGWGRNEFPEKVENITVGRTAEKIHLLHSAGGVFDPDETVIAKLVLHYADKTDEMIEIKSGVHVRDWWGLLSQKTTGDTTELAWTGSNPAIKKYRDDGAVLRIYRTTFANPNPSKKIDQVDFLSTMNDSSPFLVALTLESADEAEGPKLLFSSNRAGNFEILLMDLGTSNVKNLTNHEAEDASPAWAPDGKRIAFQSERSGNLDIYVMDADGSHVRQLTTDANPDRMPAWSPDGKKIAFCRHVNGRNPEIFVMDADGSNPVNLTNDPGFDADPAWSPDGTKILFGAARKGSGGFRLFVMNADGTNVQMLPAKSRGSPYVHPAWSPQGKQLAYTESVEGGGLEIFVCNPDGSNERRLTSSGGLTTFAAWSPDGKKIAFQHHAKFDEPGTLYVMDADGSNQKQIVAGEAQAGQATLGGGRPAWKPDALAGK
ncbi:MAG: PD40 domain-containing protein [Verrucomicrobia bacterium]|nr:PD40 domain-containing protein [Verrucomicrobiota bacterium]